MNEQKPDYVKDGTYLEKWLNSGTEHVAFTEEDNIKILGVEAFDSHKKLKSADLSQVEEIEYACFCENFALENVTLSSDLKKIGRVAFANCRRLKEIKIPENQDLVIEATSFFDDDIEVEFGNRTDFSNIYDNTLLIAGSYCPCCKQKIQKKVTGFYCSTCDQNFDWDEIETFQRSYMKDKELVKYTGSLKYCIIPKGIKEIATSAFEDGVVGSVEMPDTIEKIGSKAFFWCDRLSDIRVSEKVKRIEFASFSNTCVDVLNMDHVCLEYIGKNSFAGNKNLSELELDSDIKIIAEKAFYECDLSRVKFHKSTVKIIGKEAFCKNNATKIRIPCGLKQIQEKAFYDCARLESILFPEGILVIGRDAFRKCDRLEKVELPDTLISLQPGAFLECRSLKLAILPITLAHINLDEIFEPYTEVRFKEEFWYVNRMDIV